MQPSGILESIKLMLGINKELTEFDYEIVAAINSAFSSLYQLGVGPEGFEITGYDEAWDSFSDDAKLINLARSYIYHKTRLQFDPPTNSFLVNAIENQLKEIEFRLNIYAEGAFDGR